MFYTTLHLLLAYPMIPVAFSFLLLLSYTIYLHHKVSRFTRGAHGSSLEEVIHACVNGVNEIQKRNEVISEHALSLDNRVSHSLRNIQTIRYKAFDANGSNQSFSIALLNEKGNGAIITSLHARDRVNTFAKPVINYESTYELTEEEKAVITDAKLAHKK